MTVPAKCYPIGTTFKTSGKNPQTCTVTDIYRTKNHKNELIKVRYAATHEFCGQTVTDGDVLHTTISKGLIQIYKEPDTYIIYNPSTLQVVRTYKYFGDWIDTLPTDHPGCTWINRTHPKNKALLPTLIFPKE